MMSLVDQARSKSSKAAIVLQSSERTKQKSGARAVRWPVFTVLGLDSRFGGPS